MDSGSSPRLTRTNAFLGTPQYMSPEGVLAGEKLTTRRDLFSFGIMAYELLTGDLPFKAPPAYQALAGHQLPEVALIEKEGVSPELAHALRACLSLEPDQRPTAEQLRGLLGG